MKIHAYASQPHFMDHLLPIFNKLPESMRGWTEIHRNMPKRSDPDDIIMVAANGDFIPGRRNIYVEHGAGQKYVEYRNKLAHKSYHGSELPENVICAISPRQDVADSWNVPAFAAGAPICDPYHLYGSQSGVVAITFHWNAEPVCPEATSAFAHYFEHLGRLIYGWRQQGLTVLGHYHPKFPQLADRWNSMKVPIATADEVRNRADILIADNTSLAYEMAYLGRNVISLNAPWYRRDVDHGLRFWDHVPGIQVDDADELHALDLTCLPAGVWRAETTEYVYGKPLSRGDDGMRAAAWITQFVHGL